MAGVLFITQTISEVMNHLCNHIITAMRFRSAAILFAITVIVLIFGIGIGFNSPTDQIGVIRADYLNMRPEPGTHAPPITVLKQGTEVKIINREGMWLKIEYNGKVGYIQHREQYVHIIPAKPKKKTSEEKINEPSRKIERFRREAEEIERQLERREAKLRDITHKELGVLGSLNKLDLSMDKARRSIAINNSRLAVIEKKIAEKTEHYKNLTKQIKINEDYAAKRLVAIYKISWLGKMNILASAGSMHELLMRQRNLERILAHDEKVRQDLLEDKTRLKDLLDRLNEQQLEKQKLQANIRNQIKEISHKRADRNELLEEIRNKRSLQIEAIESLKQAAAELDQTIETLEVEIDPTQQITNINMQPFSEFKGLLKMPVKGKIISLFGPYKHPKFEVTNFRSGIDIEAKKGAKVLAVFAGHIAYAGWFKGYGNMIIIDHGGSYFTVYAHLETLLKTRGDYVNSGDDIATVGDTGSMFGPNLYFEVRHHGEPMDPLEWIIKG
ncbi:MAG: peptidoglycan DD-metalloendopeptidase family protein [Deltaproteobacteria bacterium]|nr:MAG: peptidoglycan DD-metalloendopeptidase family protein [Deltaproteobacteria bacterium]